MFKYSMKTDVYEKKTVWFLKPIKVSFKFNLND